MGCDDQRIYSPPDRWLDDYSYESNYLRTCKICFASVRTMPESNLANHLAWHNTNSIFGGF